MQVLAVLAARRNTKFSDSDDHTERSNKPDSQDTQDLKLLDEWAVSPAFLAPQLAPQNIKMDKTPQVH